MMFLLHDRLGSTLRKSCVSERRRTKWVQTLCQLLCQFLIKLAFDYRYMWFGSYHGPACGFLLLWLQVAIAPATLFPLVVFQLTVPRRFFCYSSSLFVRLWFHMWLWCTYLLPISSFFGASEGLCSVVVAFPGYLHLYFCD